jgi:hypothetical protein
MANPTLTLPDVELDMFDDIIDDMERNDERPRNHSRSAELRYLVQAYILENIDQLEGTDDWEYYQMYLDRTESFGEPPR